MLPKGHFRGVAELSNHEYTAKFQIMLPSPMYILIWFVHLLKFKFFSFLSVSFHFIRVKISDVKK